VGPTTTGGMPKGGDEWMMRVEERYRAGDLDDVNIEALRKLRRASREIPLDSLLGEIRCPVLVVTGDQGDVLLGVEYRERYQRALRDVRIVTLAGAGHMLRVDGRADVFEREIGRFLATAVDGRPN